MSPSKLPGRLRDDLADLFAINYFVNSFPPREPRKDMPDCNEKDFSHGMFNALIVKNKREQLQDTPTGRTILVIGAGASTAAAGMKPGGEQIKFIEDILTGLDFEDVYKTWRAPEPPDTPGRESDQGEVPATGAGAKDGREDKQWPNDEQSRATFRDQALRRKIIGELRQLNALHKEQDPSFESRLTILLDMYAENSLRDLVIACNGGGRRFRTTVLYEVIAHMFHHRMIDVIINFNFDELLDQAIREEFDDGTYYRILSDQDCPKYEDVTHNGRINIPLYIKPHGTVSDRGSLRFTKDAYFGVPGQVLDFIQKLFEGNATADTSLLGKVEVNLITIGFAMESVELNDILSLERCKPHRFFFFDLVKDSELHPVTEAPKDEEKWLKANEERLSKLNEERLSKLVVDKDALKMELEKKGIKNHRWLDGYGFHKVLIRRDREKLAEGQTRPAPGQEDERAILTLIDTFVAIWELINDRYTPTYKPRTLARHMLASRFFDPNHARNTGADCLRLELELDDLYLEYRLMKPRKPSEGEKSETGFLTFQEPYYIEGTSTLLPWFYFRARAYYELAIEVIRGKGTFDLKGALNGRFGTYYTAYKTTVEKIKKSNDELEARAKVSSEQPGTEQSPNSEQNSRRTKSPPPDSFEAFVMNREAANLKVPPLESVSDMCYNLGLIRDGVSGDRHWRVDFKMSLEELNVKPYEVACWFEGNEKHLSTHYVEKRYNEEPLPLDAWCEDLKSVVKLPVLQKREGKEVQLEYFDRLVSVITVVSHRLWECLKHHETLEDEEQLGWPDKWLSHIEGIFRPSDERFNLYYRFMHIYDSTYPVMRTRIKDGGLLAYRYFHDDNRLDTELKFRAFLGASLRGYAPVFKDASFEQGSVDNPEFRQEPDPWDLALIVAESGHSVWRTGKMFESEQQRVILITANDMVEKALELDYPQNEGRIERHRIPFYLHNHHMIIMLKKVETTHVWENRGNNAKEEADLKEQIITYFQKHGELRSTEGRTLKMLSLCGYQPMQAIVTHRRSQHGYTNPIYLRAGPTPLPIYDPEMRRYAGYDFRDFAAVLEQFFAYRRKSRKVHKENEILYYPDLNDGDEGLEGRGDVYLEMVHALVP